MAFGEKNHLEQAPSLPEFTHSPADRAQGGRLGTAVACTAPTCTTDTRLPLGSSALGTSAQEAGQEWEEQEQ